jgi:hypothetical protein
MKHPDTQFLRALAIVLIINSHLDRYYPIPYIGTGGAIGNSIFFFLSAFGLYISQQERNKHFTEWFTNRIGRIYPSLWIVLISLYMPVLIWQGKLSYSTVTTFIGYFFSPPYLFLQVLLVYYLLAFPLIKNLWKTNILVILVLLSLIYIGCYITIVDLSRWSVEESPFDLIHYFMVFIFGIYIAKKSKDIIYSGPMNYFYLFLFIGLVYTHKFLMLKGLYLEYQFLQQASMYPILYYLLKISRSPLIVTRLMRSPVLSRAVEFIANNTLEIYIVHQTISYPLLYMQMSFPINLIVFLLLTFSLSAIVNRLANAMRKSIL